MTLTRRLPLTLGVTLTLGIIRRRGLGLRGKVKVEVRKARGRKVRRRERVYVLGSTSVLGFFFLESASLIEWLQ